jgi:hypothetical protein
VKKPMKLPAIGFGIIMLVAVVIAPDMARSGGSGEDVQIDRERDRLSIGPESGQPGELIQHKVLICKPIP